MVDPQLIYPGLYVGGQGSCFYDDRPDWAVIHATKHPCHKTILGYANHLPGDHPSYLTYERGNHLYLNMIDPIAPLFKLPLFQHSIEFLEKHEDKDRLVHCNVGLSRSPSLAMVYMAHKGIITNHSFAEAHESFLSYYPIFTPSLGILAYLNNNWREVIHG